jgi:hypothetical protein
MNRMFNEKTGPKDLYYHETFLANLIRLFMFKSVALPHQDLAPPSFKDLELYDI